MQLTPSQRQAIEHDGRNLQLIACAGSGKTEVVARRVVYLLRPGGLAPRNLVAITYTKKGAAELKERIVTRCRQAYGDLPGLAEMFVGTIHAYCLELLKSEVPKYLKFEELNEVQQALFVERHSRASGLTGCTDLTGKALHRFKDSRNYIAALSILREADIDKAALGSCSLVAGLERYRDLLEDKDYLDFSAILEEAVGAIWQEQDVRERLAKRVKYVIVDEYQDVNPIQEAIVWELHELGAQVCVVGDDDQTIYQWRGSDVEQITISLGDGVTVNGRIDLVRRLDTDETTIVDLKSNQRAQAEAVTERQLHVYALGYEELTGRRADYVEIYELDEGRRRSRSVDEDFIADVRREVRQAAAALRTGELEPTPSVKKCRACDFSAMCSACAPEARGET